jgi:hypothetical protein
MTQGATGASRLRWPYGTGPETVAMGLSVLVIAVVLLVLGPLGLIGSQPEASPAPGALASGGPSATSRLAGSTVNPSVAPSPVAWRTTADAIIRVDARLIEARDGLADTLDSSTASTSDLVRQLRAMNATLVTAEALGSSLAETDAPVDLVTSLRTRYKTAHDLVEETLSASVQNTKAYETGATAIVKELKALEQLDVKVAQAGGVATPAP